MGVEFVAAQVMAGGMGNVTVVGNAGDAANLSDDGFNHGVSVDLTSLITSAGGDVSVNGTGGAGGDSNYGVWVNYMSEISAGGTGKVTVEGTGGASTGVRNYGVYVNNSGSAITSSGGDVEVTGTGGGSGTGTSNHGVYVTDAGQISAAAKWFKSGCFRRRTRNDNRRRHGKRDSRWHRW